MGNTREDAATMAIPMHYRDTSMVEERHVQNGAVAGAAATPMVEMQDE